MTISWVTSTTPKTVKLTSIANEFGLSSPYKMSALNGLIAQDGTDNTSTDRININNTGPGNNMAWYPGKAIFSSYSITKTYAFTWYKTGDLQRQTWWINPNISYTAKGNNVQYSAVRNGAELMRWIKVYTGSGDDYCFLRLVALIDTVTQPNFDKSTSSSSYSSTPYPLQIRNGWYYDKYLNASGNAESIGSYTADSYHFIKFAESDSTTLADDITTNGKEYCYGYINTGQEKSLDGTKSYPVKQGAKYNLYIQVWVYTNDEVHIANNEPTITIKHLP